MYPLLKYFLFLFSPENAHKITMGLLNLLSKFSWGRWVMKKIFCYENKKLNLELAGMLFKNGVGLAAGFDKDAKYIDALACLGFGYVEIGTLTPKAQPGNEKPRLFRLQKDEALINRMGFNNEGVEAAVNRLKKVKSDILIGGNIGKNKSTPNEEAHLDYAICFEALYDYVDYFVVNVSSPNTPGLRALQEKPALLKILTELQLLRASHVAKAKLYKPIFLKIAPDLTQEQLDDIIALSLEIQLDGLVATNTTISREGLSTDSSRLDAIGNGGLSGLPLLEKSNRVLDYLIQGLNQKIPVIGVGGIHSAENAMQKLNLGAASIQLYTGFIYEGPLLIKKILRQWEQKAS